MKSLEHIQSKLEAGKRLTLEDGVFLYEHPDLLGIGQLANNFREQIHGDITWYNINLHLNATNVCRDDCIFCSFARLKTGMPEAYTMSVDQALNWINERYQPGMTEIHIVNGNNPDLPFSYYTDLLSAIRERFPKLHLKAFTAVEIHFFSDLYDMSYREVLEQLLSAGLGSMPGGGAEIFAPRARKKLCKDKADADQWLEVHRVAHSMGLKSNCTMLFGTIETLEERVDHFIRLRELQDETGGFQAFIPLSYHPDNNRLGPVGAPSGADELRTIAVSRLMLDNIPNIKAYWIMLGINIAQLAQRFGANDMDGTVVEEKIYHMAGATTPNALTVKKLQKLITEIGRKPVERDTLYEVIDAEKEVAVGQMR